jgi:hypothetical protein
MAAPAAFAAAASQNPGAQPAVATAADAAAAADSDIDMEDDVYTFSHPPAAMYTFSSSNHPGVTQDQIDAILQRAEPFKGITGGPIKDRARRSASLASLGQMKSRETLQTRDGFSNSPIDKLTFGYIADDSTAQQLQNSMRQLVKDHFGEEALRLLTFSSHKDNKSFGGMTKAVYSIKVAAPSGSSEAALVLLVAQALSRLTQMTVADVLYQPAYGQPLELREGAPMLTIGCSGAASGSAQNQANLIVPVGICGLQLDDTQLPGLSRMPVVDQATVLAYQAAQQSSNERHAAILNVKEFRDAPGEPGIRNAVMHTLQAAQRMPLAGSCSIKCSSGSMEIYPEPWDLRGMEYGLAARLGVSSDADLAAVATSALNMASAAADKLEASVPPGMRPPNATRSLALLGRSGSIVGPDDISSSSAQWCFSTVRGVPLGFVTESERASLPAIIIRCANPQTMTYIVSAAVLEDNTLPQGSGCRSLQRRAVWWGSRPGCLGRSLLRPCMQRP